MGNKIDLIKIRRDLHRIPELGFREFKTQQYLLGVIQNLSTERVEIKTWRTGIIVKIHGHNPTKTIGYRADIDGLPIIEETGLDFLSEHPTEMHACGHDFHMTIALGVLANIIESPLKDDVVFIFQPAEEGPGGAEPMLQSQELKEWMPDMILALHVAPEYPVGTIAIKTGLLFANTSELFIDLKGKGGHAAYPHLTNDMVVAACSLVSQLQSVVSRNIDPLDSAVVTIGKITGGTVQNVIAENARLEGTMRTLSSEAMEKVKNRVQSLVKGIEIGYDCECTIDFGSGYYQVYNNEPLTREFMDFVEQETEATIFECKEAMTGEDFGYMLRDIPGFMFWLGVDSPYGLHHSKLDPKEDAIQLAVNALTAYLMTKGN
ncbi:N-acetyldiaminopimelate deacetylase [Cytobacillus oceanisediminis]|uniref:N-acetyldiaminopimelate deacetylase n=2 Tax=Niallia TaxID=2837506 RepID=A0A941GHT2_NIACI|nr:MULTISPECIES: N-acetyldiaminopimelate deacetylase [Bacillaceae]EOR26880.1 metal-dependent amidase/aminoacylase/carboxypeptidase [Niallia nealsonii AAU1]MBQ6447719.1 N-acetyldiaminopimelate deacetylase [Bacillus sp. (in: firmicutes)]MBZ9533424.1 N-acetyldiaminopimelate deacetylase [Cytobacillus oceanisediminis]MCB5237622.1 N-acetyldiaminopimelate deacetylase [Niallia circulans]MED3795559.1 N-acetyldiaminopimelate deacetylase [Niallia alba]